MLGNRNLLSLNQSIDFHYDYITIGMSLPSICRELTVLTRDMMLFLLITFMNRMYAKIESKGSRPLIIVMRSGSRTGLRSGARGGRSSSNTTSNSPNSTINNIERMLSGIRGSLVWILPRRRCRRASDSVMNSINYYRNDFTLILTRSNQEQNNNENKNKFLHDSCVTENDSTQNADLVVWL